MRLDRLLTLYFFHPLTGILRRNIGVRIPILMYHSVSDRDADVSHAYYQTNTKPEIFARQMQFLADNNYKVITLTEAIDLISGHSSSGSLPVTGHRSPVTEAPRYAVLTFDDGYKDFYDVAWPDLKKHSFTATMFLPTGFISNKRQCLNSRDCLTWDEVKALAGEGVAFGAHTVSHVQLYDIDRGKIAHELTASKVAIEKQLGKPVDHYAYALAFPEHDEEFVTFYEKSLREAGYRGAMSTRIGTVDSGDNLYRLKRLPVNTHDDIKLFQAKLKSGYDWLYKFQYIKKKISFVG